MNSLWFVAAVVVATLVALRVHRNAQNRFATANLLDRIVGNSSLGKKLTSIALTSLAMITLAVASTDIRWGKAWREVPQKGIEIVFALDVSRSMLATDIVPDRLSRAKQNIEDIVDAMSGDRVGLILFAGDVRRHIPLTSHYEDFKQNLAEVGPHNINRGGTNLGDAIRIASDSFLQKTADQKAIVIITDGEDHESDPIAAAKEAHEQKGVRIFTVGLGDTKDGARIPLASGNRRRSFMHHDGKQVWSKLDGETLKAIANATDGAYVPAGTKQVDMGEVYHRFIAGIQEQQFDTAKINGYIPRYQWFMGFALCVMLLDVFLSTRRSRRASTTSERQTVRSVELETAA